MMKTTKPGVNMNAPVFPLNRGKTTSSLLGWFSRRSRRGTDLAKPAAPTPVAPRGKKILVVDDDAIIRKTTALKLEADGYTVVTATDGPQALNVIRQERPDLILMDINFPSDMGGVVWDGFATMSWLRRTEQGRDLPVIIISGSNVEQWKGRALDAGAVGVFPKPIDHNGLLAAIERTLSGPAAAGNGFQAEFQF